MAGDDEDRERHINIHFSPEIMAGVYANFANVSHSDYEFTITFARVDHEVEEDEIPGVVVSRVNLSAQFMRELIDAMEDNYSKWQHARGDQEPARVRPGRAASAGRAELSSRSKATPARSAPAWSGACPAATCHQAGGVDVRDVL